MIFFLPGIGRCTGETKPKPARQTENSFLSYNSKSLLTAQLSNAVSLRAVWPTLKVLLGTVSTATKVLSIETKTKPNQSNNSNNTLFSGAGERVEC